MIRILTLVYLLCCASTLAAAEQFPTAISKKGLQVQMVDDALTLGIKHATLNVNLSQFADPQDGPRSIPFESAGRTYRLRRGYTESLDRQIKALSDGGVIVYLILLAYESGDPKVNELVLHPRYNKSAPNKLGAFNTVSEDGRRWFSACIEFMAARWSGASREHGQVAGHIIGNEVNSHWWWSNMGRVSMEEFADDYLRTVRLAHTALRKHSPWARVYLSLEHHWNKRFGAGDERQSFPGRPFLDYFAAQARKGGDFDWHIAFHPYPENLFEPRFWRDKTATFKDDTPRITFKNIEMLPAYLERPELRFNGQVRRIILSEQGFHTPDGPEGETIQAAAYCYAYRRIETIRTIDAFILHRHVDHSKEGGLRLGLWRNKPGSIADPDTKKRIYDCFRLADTPQWREAFNFALPIIGLENWEEAPRR